MAEELKKKFYLQCEVCLSNDIKIETIGYDGKILIYCNEQECDNQHEV